MKLLEGVKISKSVLDKVYRDTDDVNMGFECEFYTGNPNGEAGGQIDVSSAHNYEAIMPFFDDNDIDDDDLEEWVRENLEVLMRETEFSEEQALAPIYKAWFDEHPNWEEDYLKSYNGWDSDKNAPTKEFKDQDIERLVMDKIEDEEYLFNNGKTLGDYLENAKVKFYMDEEDAAGEWFNDSPHNFINGNNWTLSYGYEWSEDDGDVIVKTGGGMFEVADSFNDEFGVMPEVVSDYHGEYKETDTWYLEPDGSLTQDDGGTELVSPVMPLDEGLSELERTFNWMISEDYTTDDSTGLHISLSIDEAPDVDWVKLALFIGDEHLLDQFDRLHNDYTRSQFEKVEQYISNNNITKIKGWSGFKDLANSISKTLDSRTSSFNIADFHNNGRIEFRIMGGGGYEKRFEEVKYNILRFVLVMKIATDEDLFKKEYMKKLGKMISNQKEDVLEPKDTGFAKDVLKGNPFFSVAKQLFRRDIDAIRSIGSFLIKIEQGDREEAVQYLMTAVRKSLEDRNKESRAMFEGKTETRINAVRKFFRNMIKSYDVNKGEISNYYKKDVDEYVDAYVPIVDEYNDSNIIARFASELLPHYDEEIERKKKWVMDHLPALRKTNELTRKHLMKVLSNVDWGGDPFPSDEERVAYALPELQKAIEVALLNEPGSKVVPKLINDVIKAKGITKKDIGRTGLEPKHLAYLGMGSKKELKQAKETQDRAQLVKGLEDEHSRTLYNASLGGMGTFREMFEQMLSDDPAEKREGETALLMLMMNFMRHYERDGEMMELQKEGNPPYASLYALANQFNPGNSVPTVNQETMRKLQDWYGLEWYTPPKAEHQPIQTMPHPELQDEGVVGEYITKLSGLLNPGYAKNIMVHLSKDPSIDKRGYEQGVNLLVHEAYALKDRLERNPLSGNNHDLSRELQPIWETYRELLKYHLKSAVGLVSNKIISDLREFYDI